MARTKLHESYPIILEIIKYIYTAARTHDILWKFE